MEKIATYDMSYPRAITHIYFKKNKSQIFFNILFVYTKHFVIAK